MVSDKVEQICRDIKDLKIQGARNVAQAAVKALSVQAHESKAKDPKQALGELLEAADALAATRPTEPMMRNTLRNSIRFLLLQIRKKNIRSVADFKKVVEREEKTYFENVDKSLANIAEYGAKEMPEDGTILTHCHSNTTMAVLKRAREMDKGIRVICTETRPRYQGRISARELTAAGLPVTLIVDSAVKSFIKDVDAVIVGADAITATGDLINKIGSATIATVAYHSDTPFYSAAESHKYDPLTRWGVMETIEQRDSSEIADPGDFKGVKIENPAFDVTPAKYVTAYITEYGIMPPQSLANLLSKKFPTDNPLSLEANI